MGDALIQPSEGWPGRREPATSFEQTLAGASSHEKPRQSMSGRARTKLYSARQRRCVLLNRAITTAARSEARRSGIEKYAQHRSAACIRERPGAIARSEALPRDNKRQEAPLSQASHAHGLLRESEDQLRCGCVMAALVQAAQLSARLCSFKHRRTIL
jgi:hypothetical protein